MTPTATARPRPHSDRVRPVDAGCSRGARDRHDLLDRLAAVDENGWDSHPGEALLTYVRLTVIRPQIIARGLVGPVADHAEATAWERTWRVLNGDAIRVAASPWGILSAAARRAVADESVAAVYGTSGRTAWERRAAHRIEERDEGRHGVPSALPPLSLDALAELGHEPPDTPPEAPEAPEPPKPSALLANAAACLQQAGWSRREAAAILTSLTERAEHHRGHPRLRGGWRALAADVAIPGWQARRLTHVLLGTRGWPGLIERLATATLAQSIHDADVIDALQSTRIARMPSPELLARCTTLRSAS